MIDRDAGASAATRADVLRADAARKEAAARLWEQGAEGERRTARLLEPLVDLGWVVFHDLRVPGSRANIDHVVIGPAGVAVIDSKAYTGRLSVRDGVLWNGRYPVRLAALELEGGAVQRVVDEVDPRLRVRSIVCIHGTEVPDAGAGLDPVRLCAGADLIGELLDVPGDELTAAEVGALAAAIVRSLPPHDATTGPMPPRTAAPPSPSPGATPLRGPGVGSSRRAPAPMPAARRPSPASRLSDDVVRLVAALVVLLVVLTAGPALLTRFGEASAKVLTPTTASTPVAPPTTGPPPAAG